MQNSTIVDKSTSKGFGTFKGVYVPSILTIFGVIMFLRLGWVVGHMGLFKTIVIVVLSTAVTFVTALSISATATSMKVGGGGAYYMISRSLGMEAGAAVGIPLYLAQALGISFYLAGFSESMMQYVPGGFGITETHISLLTLAFITGVAFFSTDAALKVQFFIFAIIIASMISFFIGNDVQSVAVVPKETLVPADMSFWVVFAVFFPAVTGIEAGISMSGDLKNPSKSLPFGTLAAVVTGLVAYIVIPIIFSSRVGSDVLKTNPMIMTDLSYFGPIIILGIWGATLSSALGALLGAPRTLQALAKDRVVPMAAAKGYGDQDLPRIATLVTFLVAGLGICLGNLNAIAPVLSMFFLTSYGALNFIAGMESIIGNPSYRPKFRTPWIVSIGGAFGCFAIMFMINAGATMVAITATVLVYYLMQRRRLQAHWGDMRHGILMLLARQSIYKLNAAKKSVDAKGWRPFFLVLSGTPKTRWYLIQLANAITHGKGFLSVAKIVVEDSPELKRIDSVQKTIKDYLAKKGVPALTEVKVAKDINTGVLAMVNNYGLGPLAPNTIILGETEREENFINFCSLIETVSNSHKNLVIVRQGKNPGEPTVVKRQRIIDVWWGRERQNASLMLALGYMLKMSPEWMGSKLNLNTVVASEQERDTATAYLNSYLEKIKIDASSNAYVNSNAFDAIKEHSAAADILFLGLRAKLEEETIEDYANYYVETLQKTKNFPPTAFVIAAEEIKFNAIFDER